MVAGRTCTAYCSEVFFLEANSFAKGIMLYIDGPCLFFSDLTNVIADEAALKVGIDCKGASGLRPCAMCKNVMLKGSDVASRDASGYLVEMTTTDIDRFDWCSDQDMFDATDLLQRSMPGMGVGAFKALQMSSGLNFNPRGVLADVPLRPFSRPASSWTWDPMHCMFSNGIVSFEVHLLLQHMRRDTPFGWGDIEAFCKSDWRFPNYIKNKGRAVHEVFKKSREESCRESFKAGATELLLAFPLLLLFGELFLAANMVAEMDSLRKLGRVIYEAQEAKFGRGDAGRLLHAIQQHFAAFVLVYSDDEVKPKHHYMCHLPRQLQRDKFLIDTFALERKHYDVKKLADHTDNTREFEVSVLSRVHLAELRAHASIDDTVALRGRQAYYVPLQGRVADGLEGYGLRFHTGDIVFRDGSAFLVRGAIQFDGCDTAELLVQALQLTERISEMSAKFMTQAGLFRCGARGLRPASCWTTDDGELFTVVGC